MLFTKFDFLAIFLFSLLIITIFFSFNVRSFENDFCLKHGFAYANSWDNNQICCVKSLDINIHNNEKFDLKCFLAQKL